MGLNVIGRLPAHSYPVADRRIIDEIQILVIWFKLISQKSKMILPIINQTFVLHFAEFSR